MGFSCGIVGLPNVGKSTLYNALTAAGAASSNYPFCTIEPNRGVVNVPDGRLATIAALTGQQRAVATTLEFVDIAGLVRGASRGEGLGNQFLAQIRQVDAIAHLVRCFEDPNVVHVDGAVDPVRDAEVVHVELCLKDLETVERRLDRVAKAARAGEAEAKMEAATLEKLLDALGRSLGVRSLPLSAEERELVDTLFLLTDKPMMMVANVSDEQLDGNAAIETLETHTQKHGCPMVTIGARTEEELAELGAEERTEFLREFGLQQSALERLVQTGYKLLDLVTFFTFVGKEVRAWTIRQGATAIDAAGKIHSDMQQGFIRAEVIRYADLVSCGSDQAVRAQGLGRTEGRSYVVQDGDIMTFRFS